MIRKQEKRNDTKSNTTPFPSSLMSSPDHQSLQQPHLPTLRPIYSFFLTSTPFPPLIKPEMWRHMLFWSGSFLRVAVQRHVMQPCQELPVADARPSLRFDKRASLAVPFDPQCKPFILPYTTPGTFLTRLPNLGTRLDTNSLPQQLQSLPVPRLAELRPT